MKTIRAALGICVLVCVVGCSNKPDAGDAEVKVAPGSVKPPAASAPGGQAGPAVQQSAPMTPQK